MTTALLVISDGRYDYLERTMESAAVNLPAFDYTIHVDDTTHTLGFGGAIQEGWRQLLDTDAEYVFHLEADYLFHRPVPIAGMQYVLETHPHLVQLALRRQPWNTIEAEAGTVVPDDADEHYEDTWTDTFWWLEHTRNFTTNPCLYPRWVVEYGWPSGNESEGRFGGYLRRLNPELRFAYWGRRDDPEAVFHIGDHRTGTGY